MKRLYLMRHGESIFNIGRVKEKVADSSLTDIGQAQAKQARKYFETNYVVFNAAFCSTLKRSSDTLQIVTDIEYTPLSDLREWGSGDTEGLADLPTVENEHQVRRRMTHALTKIMEENAGNILCVSHAGAMVIFMLSLHDGNDYITMDYGNCCIFEFDYDETGFHFVKNVNPLLDIERGSEI